MEGGQRGGLPAHPMLQPHARAWRTGSGLDHAPSDGWGRAGQTASSLGATNMWASVNLCVNK